VRIARRLLENLRFRYPEDPQIVRKIAVIDEVRTHMDENEIRRRVEKTTLLEAQYKKERTVGRKAEEKRSQSPRTEAGGGGGPAAAEAPAGPRQQEDKPKPTGPFRPEVLEGEKISTADIFAETDIIPFVSAEPGERTYHDLREAAAGELRWLAAARTRQLQGDAFPLERELNAIVSEFRKDLKARGPVADADVHYQLGLAFMAQGLLAEAIEELTEAAKEGRLALDSYSLISQCYRQKRDFAEAAKWLKTAMAGAKAGTDQYFALAFELAEVAEAADDRDQALTLFREIRDWNPGFRNVAARLESLERTIA
jgi:hypothetical protein